MAGVIELSPLLVPIRGDTSDYQRSLSGAQAQTRSFAQAAGSIAAAGLKTMAVAGTAATAAVAGLTLGVGKLAVAAAPLEGIRKGFDSIAASAGTAGSTMLKSMQEASAGMIAGKDLMLSFNQAAQLVNRDFATQLPEAMESLRKVANATGKDMEGMLDSLVVGVGRLSPMILDNLSIQVSLADATQRASEMFGVEEDALTKTQQQMGMMNVVLEKLQENTAGLPDVVGTAAGELGLFKTTLADTRDAIGQTALPVLNDFMKSVNALATTALPKLVEIFQKWVIPVAGLVSKALVGLADKAVKAGTAFSDKFGAKLLAVAEKALRWGVNISVQLAKGIIQGATTAIVTAMNFISGILEDWLSPGSPPRVAPDLDKWGLAAFGEWLGGFTSGSFDALEALQGPLESALNTLVSVGAIGEGEASARFRAMTNDMAVALDELAHTGRVTIDVFSGLEQAGGVFGEQLAELARRQFDLAAATQAAADAQDTLTKSQEDLVRMERDADRAMAAYNEALAAGASPAILSAKRKEYTLARDRLSQAEAEARAAEDLIGTEQESISALEERLSLQQRLLRQMTQLAETGQVTAQAISGAVGGTGGGAAGIEALEELDAETETGEGGGSGAGVPDLGGTGEPDLAGMGDFTAHRPDVGGLGGIGQKMADIFAPVSDLSETFKTATKDIEESFGRLKSALELIDWEDVKSKISEFITAVDTNYWQWYSDNGPAVAESIERLGTALGTIIETLAPIKDQDLFKVFEDLVLQLQTDLLDGYAKSVEDLAVAAEWLAKALPELKRVWDEWTGGTEQGGEEVENVARGIVARFGLILPGVTDANDEVAGAVLRAWQGVADELVNQSIVPDMLVDIEDAWGIHYETMAENLGTFFADTKTLFQKGFGDLWTAAGTFLAKMDTGWLTTTNNIITRWKGAWTTVTADAKKLWDQLEGDFGDFAGRLAHWVGEIISTLARIGNKIDDIGNKAKAAAGEVYSLINALRTLKNLDNGWNEMAIGAAGGAMAAGTSLAGALTAPAPVSVAVVPVGGVQQTAPYTGMGQSTENNYSLTLVNPTERNSVLNEYFILEGMAL